ncbi:granulin b [Aplochiton taeniatus]
MHLQIKVVLLVLLSVTSALICPDGGTCEEGKTCCRNSSGGYGCCPLLNGVEAVICPDQESECPDDTTCCQLPEGSWGCCPFPKAVCCEDKRHCCPEGTTCDLTHSKCVTSTLESYPMLDKLPARRRDSKPEAGSRPLVTCPGQKSRCPVGSTCCMLVSGDYGCCPFPEAVCCEDQEHCCPKDYECNVSQETCDKPGALILPWLQKMLAMKSASTQLNLSAGAPSKNMCDAQTSCPRDSTCCFMNKAGKWGCCPLPRGVCCAEGDHCCPSDSICGHHASCSKGPHSVPWFLKQKTLTKVGPMVADVKCDDKSSCAAGATCCKLPSGEWGCCPLVKAVCCADHEHCCPQGYSCNMQTGTCEKKADQLLIPITVPLSKVVESQMREAEKVEDIPCDILGEFRCPKQETCCRTSVMEWACCPSQKAVCCQDSKHCCPAGYSCDLIAGGCTQQAELTWNTFYTNKRQRN